MQKRRGGNAALALMTVVWGGNWIAMKAALLHAHPLEFNVHRTWLATVVLFGVLFARGGRMWPQSCRAVIITAFFQTTIHFGETTMAVAGGGARRPSVPWFPPPFWTLLAAWSV